jgi:MerR family transcriptional regulator, light-induced transcriptional regulator
MEDSLNVFSIKDLENFSGIKAHTIRIWEKRYNILEPDRTDSNIRTYNESELKKILNVSYLNRNGLKISKIASLNDDELTRKVMTYSSKNDDRSKDFQPGKILTSAIRFNDGLFRENILSLIKQYGLEQAYCGYISTLLEKAKILWQTGSLSRAQEQFVRNTVKYIIITEDILLKSPAIYSSPSVAMINTSDNMTENNFLFYKFILKKRGFDVIYTGGILPASEVVEIYKTKTFEYLVVNSNSFDFAEKKIAYFRNIGKSLMLKKIIFTDSSSHHSTKGDDKLYYTASPEDFIKIADSLTKVI